MSNFGSNAINTSGNITSGNLLISYLEANTQSVIQTLSNADMRLTATDGIYNSSIYLWANNQRMSFNTVSNAFDFNFNGQLSATDFTASKNSSYGYSFYSEGSGYSGMRHTSGPPDVITIEHEGNVFAGFYGNYTTEIFGNLVVSSDGQSFGSFPNAYTQIYSNVNSYAQLILQNINDGELSSADLVVTSDNGNDASYYVDLGITGSNHADPDFFGDTVSVNDAYLYVTGYDQTGPSLGNIGNLIIGSTNGIVKTFIGNTAEANVITVVDSVGLTVLGNISATNYIVSESLIGTGASPAPVISGFSSISAISISASGNITGNVNGFTIGYRDIPQVIFTSNATLSLTDAGKHYYSANSANIITIPNNATVSFNIGTAVSIVQQGTANLTITPDSEVTLYLAGNSTAGSRTLGNFGMATLMKVATDTWFINGTGVN